MSFEDPTDERGPGARDPEASAPERERGCRHDRHEYRYGRGRRKERVLHTRISEDLAEDIRRLAEDLRVPVSNLVRNVLEEAFDVVETVTDNVGDLIGDVVEEADRARTRVRHRRHHGRRRRHRGRRDHEPSERPRSGAPRAEFPDVLGWQPLILNQQKACADCEETQERGERAFVGMTAGGVSGTYLCGDCMAARR